ncbi:hypothetical protein A3J41_00675 [candidate division TM6 bacterium RIFCSPHIGHO2_12_FULL_38_8]|nr:MAG: hypothetical protein A3J41_00675 [candidate division TM6 bacterium RIFCSPHIGHO2_12_FULL_38_8]
MKFVLKIWFLGFLTVFSCTARQYQLHDDVEKKYILQTDKNELFKFVGCRYLNFVKIMVSNFDQFDPTKTQWYLHNWQKNLELIKKYYHQIMHYEVAPMYLKWVSDEVGYGAFAKRDIAKEEFLGVYAGELRLMNQAGRASIEECTYAWEYPAQASDGTQFCIDPKYMGNEMRFVNHNDHPNATNIDVLINGIIYKCYVALQDIAQDAEITVDYGNGYWQVRGMVPQVLH